MCKTKQPETDNSESIQNNNLGLINLEESSMGGPGIFEIVSIILLALGILLTCHYCNRRCKQNRRREMHSAVQEGMNANNTVGYRAAGATGVPVITFEQPGSRTITMGQAAIPSAPMLQLPAPSKTHVLPQGLSVSPGLWEQCR